ncbi:single-stranded-DNA-specific exonuclease RecJ [Aphanothece hegewaldii CCALA 016]|uniref:Single-stranded-DNA-specific exonuclease RecJ n=1 Tax=Aphanothece hegewaldii CCALA 016 TaxID=2107694 RepID=A0A2T1LSI2_9CHRO|nr:single-stranded-DNA-specific exonuclease RecJ [Aphanothece hegewaldii]PSF32945.1 single-stranded-DNA-specific exonuclease RecJ [Aphanothece hegewaldii CCALA 016]
MSHSLPDQRWFIAQANKTSVEHLVQNTGLFPILAQVLLNREIITSDLAQIYLNPESQNLPSPLDEFSDLKLSVDLLAEAIASQDKIIICGDYDADGMTSTAVLLRSLTHLGADVNYLIPSRMKEGYGINTRIVEECASAGVGVILTVDNGISAYEPIARAVELGLTVIITDHHDLPEILPPADAILNPKLLSFNSPYQGLAGVGVAYILAVTTAQHLGKLQGLTDQLLELFTLGTIADLAPLTGVNRRWLKRGLKKLPKSKLAGIQALMQKSGVSDQQKPVKPDDIGFRLGPRINAVGRIGDPQIVIELLTTDDPEIAKMRAMQCEQINHQRQTLCEQIELEAIHLIENTPIQWKSDRILVVVHPEWHHGVIGIVASRLVERYGVPVFIGTYEEEDTTKIRGSARGIQEFNVFEALEFCRDLLGKFGGHKAAGGFSLATENLELFKKRLSQFAHQCLKIEYLKPLVKIDAQANFSQLNAALYQQIDSLQPWGIGNDFPVFWTENVRVIEQRMIGKNHLKVTLAQDDGCQIKAIAWRWGQYFPLPPRFDVAYKLRENIWNGNTDIELEIIGIRLTNIQNNVIKKASFQYKGRAYICSHWQEIDELRIKNEEGKVLSVKRGHRSGLLGINRETAETIDVTQPHYYQLIKEAIAALSG